MAVALLHIQGEATPLLELNPNIPKSIDLIVQKCMQKKPERRYLTASELIVDLKKAITNPNGDFVKLAAPIITDSPTISLSASDVNRIKSEAGIKKVSEEEVLHSESTVLSKEEEEGLDDVDPRIAKILSILMVVIGIVVVIVVILVVSNFIKKFGGNDNDNGNSSIVQDEGEIPDDITVTPTPTEAEEEEPVVETVKVPQLVNLTQEDAKKSLELAHKDLQAEFKEAYSDTVEAGKVIEQYPIADALVESNSRVIITISVGKEPVTLPTVAGKVEGDASKELTALGLKVTIQTQASDTVAEGNVISTVPEEGTGVYKGDEIILVVSTGKEYVEVTVPLLVDLTEDGAITALKSVGLEQGVITYEHSSEYAEGIVKYQSYTFGQKLPEGSKVDFTVSLGPVTTATPTPTPTPDSGEGDVGNTDSRYVGEVVITDSPLEEGESAEIVFDLKQDGYTTTVFAGTLSYDEFPYTLPVEGSSTQPGTISMYVNGNLYSSNSWNVTFTEVTD